MLSNAQTFSHFSHLGRRIPEGCRHEALATQAVLLTAIGNSSPVKFSDATSGVIGKAVGANGSASAFQAVHSDSGLAGVYVVSEASSAANTVSAVYGALKSLKVEGIEAVKKQAYNNALRAKAHSENFALERTAQLFQSQENFIDQIQAVSASDIEAAAKKLTSKISLASYGNIAQVPYVDTL
ncbi:unnamed protein product [Caenorhabditis sp. 36 PRJEB53466]|nr:unnamed protein product [Caenorhabditis sp. 36 PRJEB53466]